MNREDAESVGCRWRGSSCGRRSPGVQLAGRRDACLTALCDRGRGGDRGDRHAAVDGGRDHAGRDCRHRGGARSSVAALEPDVAMVVDVTHATDYPGSTSASTATIGWAAARCSPVAPRSASRCSSCSRPPRRQRGSLRHRGRLTRHPHRRRGDLQRPPRRGHGAGVGPQPLHAQSQRDGRARRSRPDCPTARRVRPPARGRYRLRAALTRPATFRSCASSSPAAVTRAVGPSAGRRAAQFGTSPPQPPAPAPPVIYRARRHPFLSDDRSGGDG